MPLLDYTCTMSEFSDLVNDPCLYVLTRECQSNVFFTRLIALSAQAGYTENTRIITDSSFSQIPDPKFTTGMEEDVVFRLCLRTETTSVPIPCWLDAYKARRGEIEFVPTRSNSLQPFIVITLQKKKRCTSYLNSSGSFP